jgi:hypothetical protein
MLKEYSRPFATLSAMKLRSRNSEAFTAAADSVWPGTHAKIFKNIFAEKFSKKLAFLT